MAEETKETAPKSDALSAEEANTNRVLINEDIRKYEQFQAQLRAKIAEYDVYIAECRTALADIDRREAGAMYPEPPEKPEQAAKPGTPAMGEPVGGK